MIYKVFTIIFTFLQLTISSQNAFRLLETERGYPLWDQAKNNDGTCNPSYNDKFPNSGNNNCDCDNFWAGCASIAMGQIMWYWQWPRNYNWEIIPSELREFTPWYNAEHLQQLIFDCATAANTHYTTCAGSWATSNNILDALKTIFKYKSSTLFRKNDGWTMIGWKNLIKTELDAGRPVILRGGDVISDWGNVHYFIVDGYNLSHDDFFHFNFGWGNYHYSMSTEQNALFKLDEINVNGGNYHKNQMAIIGISPTCSKVPNDILTLPFSIINFNTEILATNLIALPGGNSKCIIQENNNVYFTSENVIKLKPGFRAKNSSKFIARIRDINECECDGDISVPTWYNFISPNGDQINDVFSLNIHNANTYVIEVYDRCNNVIYKNAGKVNLNNLTQLWNGYGITNACDVQLYDVSKSWYISTVLMAVNFFNNCGRRISKAYPVIVIFDKNYVENIDFEIKDITNSIDTLEYLNVDSVINSEVNIYPNPTSHFINVPINISDNLYYQIYEVSNNVVLSGKLETNKIYVDCLKSGLYFLRIVTKNNIFVYKFIKE